MKLIVFGSPRFQSVKFVGIESWHGAVMYYQRGMAISNSNHFHYIEHQFSLVCESCSVVACALVSMQSSESLFSSID